MSHLNTGSDGTHCRNLRKIACKKNYTSQIKTLEKKVNGETDLCGLWMDGRNDIMISDEKILSFLVKVYSIYWKNTNLVFNVNFNDSKQL